jgi:hypothetical protein
VDADGWYYINRAADPDGLVTWRDIAPDGRVHVSIYRDVFLSDEHIVAAYIHEIHEINRLRGLFARNNGVLTNRRLGDAINRGIPANFRDEAWDMSNHFIIRMRWINNPDGLLGNTR